MTTQHDLGQRLADHFQRTAPREAPARVLRGAMTTIETTRQQRVRAPWRITHMPGPFRIVAVAAAAAAIVLGSLTVVPRTSTDSGAGPLLRLPTACSTRALTRGSIATIAGTGDAYNHGDGGRALDAGISSTNGDGAYGGIAVDASGVIYTSTGPTRSVRRIDPDGTITTMAGTPASLVFPMGLAIDAAGRVIVADPGNLSTPQTWRIEGDGTITKVAGNGTFGTTGNDGPALQAAIESAQVAAGPHGDLYLDDLDGYRRIDPAGTIHAFAGTGAEGYSGDGGPAMEATFGDSGPYLMGVAADAAGNVYLGDPGNHRIRKVDAAGTITTVAGTGIEGRSGDGGPATEAQIGAVGAMTVDGDGSLFFVDGDNGVVRKVDPAGVITTVAGTGVAGFSGDCGPAASAQLDDVSGLAVRDGVLYVVDGLNHRIRVVLL
jgi:hypothetical protein